MATLPRGRITGSCWLVERRLVDLVTTSPTLPSSKHCPAEARKPLHPSGSEA
jgi:hypothetical protein